MGPPYFYYVLLTLLRSIDSDYILPQLIKPANDRHYSGSTAKHYICLWKLFHPLSAYYLTFPNAPTIFVYHSHEPTKAKMINLWSPLWFSTGATRVGINSEPEDQGSKDPGTQKTRGLKGPKFSLNFMHILYFVMLIYICLCCNASHTMHNNNTSEKWSAAVCIRLFELYSLLW